MSFAAHLSEFGRRENERMVKRAGTVRPSPCGVTFETKSEALAHARALGYYPSEIEFVEYIGGAPQLPLFEMEAA